jgi:hypothetical protein
MFVKYIALYLLIAQSLFIPFYSFCHENKASDETMRMCMQAAENIRNLPTSDERSKFFYAMSEAYFIHISGKNEFDSAAREAQEEEDRLIQDVKCYKCSYKLERELKRGIQFVQPFLRSSNRKIKLCAEQTLRAFKSEIDVCVMIRTPNTPNSIAAEALAKSTDYYEQQSESFRDFLISCLSS